MEGTYVVPRTTTVSRLVAICSKSRDPFFIDEADEGRWNINEATRKFVSSAGENGWKTALKGGVEFDEKILERHVVDKNPEEYIDLDVVRYDLDFLTPSSHALIFKVRYNYLVTL